MGNCCRSARAQEPSDNAPTDVPPSSDKAGAENEPLGISKGEGDAADPGLAENIVQDDASSAESTDPTGGVRPTESEWDNEEVSHTYTIEPSRRETTDRH